MKTILKLIMLSLIAITAQASQPVKFDHDLNITGRPEGQENITFIISGGNGSRGGFLFDKNYIPQNKKKDACCVNFSYSDVQKQSIFVSNFGGKKDGTVLLHVMDKCAASGRRIIPIGLSRGSAAMFRALHMLEKPNEYIPELNKINLLDKEGNPNHSKLETIKKCLKKNIIFCANPLLNRKSAIKTVVQKALNNIKICGCNKITKNIPSCISSTIANNFLHYYGQYDPNDREPIDLLNDLGDYRIAFFLAKKDTMVGTEYYKNLYDMKKKHSNWIVLKLHRNHQDANIMKLAIKDYAKKIFKKKIRKKTYENN